MSRFPENLIENNTDSFQYKSLKGNWMWKIKTSYKSPKAKVRGLLLEFVNWVENAESQPLKYNPFNAFYSIIIKCHSFSLEAQLILTSM